MTYDTIIVHDLELTGRHGVYDEERAEGRRFAFDAEVDIPAGSLGTADALGRTVDYRDVAQVIVDVVRGPSVHLIETLAEEICRRILADLPVARVRLSVRKFATGVPGGPSWVGVRMERSQA